MEKEGWPGSVAEELALGLAKDHRTVDLAEVDRAILDYAAKLTRTPSAVCRRDVEALRSHGLDDRTVHDLACIVAYFAFVNRVSDGLGVELETN